MGKIEWAVALNVCLVIVYCWFLRSFCLILIYQSNNSAIKSNSNSFAFGYVSFEENYTSKDMLR